MRTDHERFPLLQQLVCLSLLWQRQASITHVNQQDNMGPWKKVQVQRLDRSGLDVSGTRYEVCQFPIEMLHTPDKSGKKLNIDFAGI